MPGSCCFFGWFDKYGVQSSSAKGVEGLKMEPLGQPLKSGKFEKALLRWDRVNKAGEKAETDKAIIDEISPRAVRVYVDEDIRAKMMFGDENFFKKGYLVDVMVKTIGGRVVLYIVTALHDIFDLDLEPED